jgi:hypothetical protein
MDFSLDRYFEFGNYNQAVVCTVDPGTGFMLATTRNIYAAEYLEK